MELKQILSEQIVPIAVFNKLFSVTFCGQFEIYAKVEQCNETPRKHNLTSTLLNL